MKKILILLLLLPVLNYAQSDSNISVISSERYAILYRGFPNPIKIAVPGAVSFTASARGLTKQDSIGNYNFNVTGIPGDTISIKIIAKMLDNSIVRESKTFEIHELEAPSSLINDNHCTSCIMLMTKREMENAVISVRLSDPAFNVRQSVTSFEIYIPGAPGLIIYGDKVNGEALKYIDKLKPGDEIIISNIINTFRGLGSVRMKGPLPIIIQIAKEP